MKAIETKRLTKYYGKSRGIIDVDLSVEKGDFFGFVGPNGAGKSTLIRTLLGLIRQTSGSAAVFGMDTLANRNEILSRVGYLPSEVTLYKGMKVKDILAYSANLRRLDCREEAHRLCELLELDTERKVDELSFGNRKKVGIVCAMQHRPDLYILDEPTSGLDPLMQRQFYAILEERNEQGATVFLSSHVLSEIERYCKHAAVIREGRILVCDSVENLGHTGVKRVTLRGCESKSAIHGVKDLKSDGDGVTFLYEGESSQLLQLLFGLSFSDFTVTDPDLEEVFLHYYKKEDA
ncbi:MAG: ABC transporter ATP-binding protein [Ruminococcaceae bacterium]|nr:ABC transporter ATP-binding protein [Oscillospiraceae bacterium]